MSADSTMHNQEQIIRTLRGYGFKPYEIAVYLDVLKHDISTANDVAHRTKVPYGRIYEIIKSLLHKGCLQEYQSRPKTYRAVSPHILTDTLIEKEEEKLKLMYEQADSLRRELAKIAYGNGARYLINTILTSPEIVETSSKQIVHTKSSLVVCLDSCRLYEIYSDPRIKELWNSYLRILEQAINKGVHLKLLISTDGSKHTISQAKITNLVCAVLSPKILKFEKPLLEIRYFNNPITPFNIYDNDRVLIKIKDPAREGHYIGGILIFDLKLAKTMMEIFNTMWKRSNELNIKVLKNPRR
jgi:sugar-specific transcriptional regulator TrmB